MAFANLLPASWTFDGTSGGREIAVCAVWTVESIIEVEHEPFTPHSSERFPIIDHGCLRELFIDESAMN